MTGRQPSSIGSRRGPAGKLVGTAEAASLQIAELKQQLRDARKEIQGLTAANTRLGNITNRRSAGGEDLQSVLDSFATEAVFLDEKLRIQFFSLPAAAQFNLTPADVGRAFADLPTPFIGFDLAADAEAVLRNFTPIRREIRNSSGTWYGYRVVPRRTANDRSAGVVIFLRKRGWAEAIIDTISVPLVLLDEQMAVISAGRSFYRYFDASPKKTLGRALFEAVDLSLDVPRLRNFLHRLREGSDASATCEIEVGLGSQTRRTLLVRADRIKRNGVGDFMLLTFEDVTDFRAAERIAAAARQEAENSNLAKSRLLAAVSHDLRQPLQALALLPAALEPSIRDERGQELLSRATTTVDNMARMIDTLLDINQLEFGAVEADQRDFPINTLFDRLDAEFSAIAASRGLDWRVMRSELIAHSDLRLLEQMLRNLGSNAVNYTVEGGVLVGCRRRGDTLSIEVWDTGVGIASDDIQHIFDEYHRGSNHLADGGAGLGLAIVDRLALILNHPVAVRSTLGKGSVFSIEVPRGHQSSKSPQKRTDEPTQTTAVRTGTILVVEEDVVLRGLVQSALGMAGHRVIGVGSCDAALVLLATERLRPDLIVSDYWLPGGMNGAETIAALRAALGWQVPAIVLTGDAGASTLPGADDLSVRLVKPVKREELSQTVQQLFAETKPR